MMRSHLGNNTYNLDLLLEKFQFFQLLDNQELRQVVQFLQLKLLFPSFLLKFLLLPQKLLLFFPVLLLLGIAHLALHSLQLKKD